jgi:dTDP-4-amino-4,6-dideoxygalactose transaminase
MLQTNTRLSAEQKNVLSPPLPDNRSVALTTSGTTAFEQILQRESLRGSSVLFPAFVCEDAFAPLIERYNLDPTFVDVDPDTRHLDLSAVENHRSSVDAIVLVHTFGLPLPAGQWESLRQQDDLVLVEDCARALGACADGAPVGSVGDYALYSLRKVTPLFTGGILVGRDPRTSFDLAPPVVDPDLLVKTAYDSLPVEIPFREQIATYYNASIGNQGRSNGENGQSHLDETTPVRRLDPVNRWRVKRYILQQFHRDCARRREIAEKLREVLDAHGFGLQPDPPERVHHALSATAPRDRDELVEFLSSRDHTVRPVWERPLGLEYGSPSDYPVTAELADRVVLVPLVGMSHDGAARLERDIEQFYGGELSQH